MKISLILKKFLFILNYQQISLLKNSVAFIFLGLIDVLGLLMLGLAAKGLKDFEKTKSQIIDYFNFINLDFLNIQIFFILVFIIFAIRSIFHLFIIYLNSRFINNCVVRLKSLALTTYLSSKVNDINFLEVKNVLNFSISRPDDIGKLLTKSLQLCKELIVFLSVTSLLIYVNFKLLVVSILVFIIIAISYFSFIKPKLSIFSRDVNKERLNKLKVINTVFLIFKESKFYSTILDFKKRSKETDNKAAKISTITAVLANLPTILAETIIIFLVCAIILFQTFFSEINENFLYSAVLFLAGAYRIKPFFVVSLDYLTAVKLAENSVIAFYDLLKHDKKLSEKKSDLIENFSINKVNLKNIEYSIDSKKIFLNLNFNATRGESIFVCGDSGTGKTTLLNLLLNFKIPSKGHLLINGKNIKDYDNENFLTKINYLQQDPSIFDGTFAENITLQEFENINTQKLKEVIDLTNLKNFFTKRCNNNYNFNLKELGNNISGGEKQRITLARVMYDPRDLIILDEPVKSLDENAQHLITKNLTKKLKDKILIFLSHNPSLSTYFDKEFNLTEQNKLEKN